MGPTLRRPRQNQTMTTNHSGHIRILAPPFEHCPGCDAMNTADTGSLWRVTDERGLHLECDACGLFRVAPTDWINGRAMCKTCGFVGWVIKHPDAEVVCPKCGGPTTHAVGDEYDKRLYQHVGARDGKTT